MKRTLFLRVAALVASLSLAACGSIPDNLLSPPKVELTNVQVVGLGFQKQTFLLSFDIANPNAFSLPVRTIQYGLRLDGQHFAGGETDSEFTVPASGATNFAISVDLDLLKTSPQLLGIVRDGVQRDIAYELDGSLGVDIPLAPAVKYNTNGTIRLSSKGE